MFGWWVFAESLPGTWWIGAALLVAGSVIISRRDTEKEKARAGQQQHRPVRSPGREAEGEGEGEGEELLARRSSGDESGGESDESLRQRQE